MKNVRWEPEGQLFTQCEKQADLWGWRQTENPNRACEVHFSLVNAQMWEDWVMFWADWKNKGFESLKYNMTVENPRGVFEIRV